MNKPWFSVWYEPGDEETVAFISMERIAEIGGMKPGESWTAFAVNQGNSVLLRWCRLNCKLPGAPVNVRGRTGWAFKNSDDALLFKLTWG